MRSLPAGWPDPTDPLQTAPVVYLKMLDASWPPASVQGGESLPAGVTRVGSWEIDADLDAPLMPGQITAGTKFTIASGACTIPQPETGLLAPWRAGNERTPTAGRCELVASYDGWDGSTAYVLGQFMLDPMKGKVSEPFLSLTLVQDLVRLRKPHGFPVSPEIDGLLGAPGKLFSPTDLLRLRAEANGYTFETSGDFETQIDGAYFPGKMDELSVFQAIVSANLGALFLRMDGTTVVVKDPDALLGTGQLDGTLQVLDHFEDLSWSQDPNAAVDRIVVTYVPPSWDVGETPDDSSYFIDGIDEPAVWYVPRGAYLNPGASVTYTFDPGRATFIHSRFGDGNIWGTTKSNGTGVKYLIDVDVTYLSSGAIQATIRNERSIRIWLRAPYYPGTSGDSISGGMMGGRTDYPKNTRSWVGGTLDGSSETESAKTLTWGVAETDATNTLQFDLGRNVQSHADALRVLERIVTRVADATYILDDVRVIPDVRRELADLYRLELPEAGFLTRAMVTGIKTSGGPGGIEQTVTIAVLPLKVMDFDEAWDTHHPGATLNDFDAYWDAKHPGATLNDFDADPLSAG